MTELEDKILRSNIWERLDRIAENNDEFYKKIDNIGKKADELVRILKVINEVKGVEEKKS